MDRKQRQEWLLQRRNGFLHYVYTKGLACAFAFVFGLEFINNDFYLDVISPGLVHLYMTTLLVAFICSAINWTCNECSLKRSKVNPPT